MTRLEKIQLAINKGFTYCKKTGNIISPTGKVCVKKSNNGYIMLTVRDENKKAYYLYGHQLAWYLVNKQIVPLIDHINRVKTDNRIINLRSITKSQNSMNANNIKGYSFDKKNKKYESYINLKGKKIHLGFFKTIEEASNCYLENKKKYHIINKLNTNKQWN